MMLLQALVVFTSYRTWGKFRVEFNKAYWYFFLFSFQNDIFAIFIVKFFLLEGKRKTWRWCNDDKRREELHWKFLFMLQHFITLQFFSMNHFADWFSILWRKEFFSCEKLKEKKKTANKVFHLRNWFFVNLFY